VLNVYSSWFAAGVIHKMIAVLEFPPNDDLRILVNGEFLYGICCSFFFPSAFNAIT